MKNFILGGITTTIAMITGMVIYEIGYSKACEDCANVAKSCLVSQK